MPRIRRVLETALYVSDMERSVGFYERVLGLGVLTRGERMSALDAGGGTILLLFLQGASTEPTGFEGGTIPGHDGSGRLHVAFAVDGSGWEDWSGRLDAEGIALESEVAWGRGGRSLYFRDPDGHSIELASPGVWPVY